MKNLERTQFATSFDADFEEKKWSFEMVAGFTVSAGEFAITPKQTYYDLFDALSDMIYCYDVDVKKGSSQEELLNRAKEAIRKATEA